MLIHHFSSNSSSLNLVLPMMYIACKNPGNQIQQQKKMFTRSDLPAPSHMKTAAGGQKHATRIGRYLRVSNMAWCCVVCRERKRSLRNVRVHSASPPPALTAALHTPYTLHGQTTVIAGRPRPANGEWRRRRYLITDKRFAMRKRRKRKVSDVKS